MLTFTTKSAATYTVKDGRISREEGRTSILGVPEGFTVAMQPFEWLVEPKVGERAVYRLTDLPNLPSIYTSLVESIEAA